MAEVLLKAGRYVFKRSQYEQGTLLCQRALHLFEQTLGPDHLQVAFALHTLAAVIKKNQTKLRIEVRDMMTPGLRTR